jgi:hypothetical protein
MIGRIDEVMMMTVPETNNSFSPVQFSEMNTMQTKILKNSTMNRYWN